MLIQVKRDTAQIEPIFKAMPHPSRLCTAVAKRPDILNWSNGRACFRLVPQFVKDEWEIALT